MIDDGNGEDDAIREFLATETVDEAVAAIERLGQLRVGASHLWDVIEDPRRNPRLRSTALRALALFPATEADEHEPFVLMGTLDSNPYVVEAAIRAATHFDLWAAVDTVEPLATSPNAKIRAAALLLLGRVGGNDSLPTVLGALADPDLRVVEKATRALRNMARRLPEVRPDLESRLPQLLASLPNVEVHGVEHRIACQLTEVAEVLDASEPLDEVLVGLLCDNVGARGPAAKALAAHGVESARPLMEELLLAETSPKIRTDLLSALVTLDIQPSLVVISDLLTGPAATELRSAVLAGVVNRRDVESIAILLDLANGPDATTRAQVCAQIDLGHPVAGEVLSRAASDTSLSVRWTAIERIATVPWSYDVIAGALAVERNPDLRERMEQLLAEQPTSSARPNGGGLNAIAIVPIAALALVSEEDTPVDAAIRLLVNRIVAASVTSAADTDREIATQLDTLAAAAVTLRRRLTGSA